MFMLEEKLSQVPPVPEDYSVIPSPLRIASPLRVPTVYNKLTGGGGVGMVWLHPTSQTT
jgi:hypothetical protein